MSVTEDLCRVTGIGFFKKWERREDAPEKNMKKILVAATLFQLFFLGQRLSAQTTGAVSGKVLDEKGLSAPFVTVSLLRQSDSVLVKGAITNGQGIYLFERIAAGSYLVKATMIGYRAAYSSAKIDISANGIVTVPDLNLSPASNQLKGVTISSTRPPIEHHAGITTMNIENSVLAAGNNALEILARSPGVTIDKDDNISLQGKAGVSVMIDGKLTYLSAEQLGSLLRSTDGSTIKSIELIPNPSAKYDAAGTAGIINIKLKKNTISGTTGSLTTGAAVGTHWRDNSSFQISHKQGILNLFGTFTHSDNTELSNTRLAKTVDSAGTPTYFKQADAELNKRHSNTYRLGADLMTSSKNTLGFVFSGFYNPSEQQSNNLTALGTKPQVFNTNLTTAKDDSRSRKNNAYNLNDVLKLDSAGQQISFDLDYSTFDNNSNAFYNTNYTSSTGAAVSQPLVRTNLTPSIINIYAAQADYTVTLDKTLKLESGGKYSSVNTDNDQRAQILSAGKFINDTLRSNHFNYDEKIAAAYVSLTKNFKGLTVNAGLRTEYTHSTGDLITTNTVVNRHYTDFFPNFSVSKEISPKNDLNLSFSRRIIRPNYGTLNPFISYDDQYTYLQGNPFLNASYSNNYHLNYTYNKTVNLTLAYQHTTGELNPVFLTDSVNKATIATYQNLGKSNLYSLDLSTPFTLFRWWTGLIDLNGQYRKDKANNANTGTLDHGVVFYELFANQSFALGKSYRAELTSIYYSSQSIGFLNIKPIYKTDAGISHSFAGKAANIKFSVDDIFNSLKTSLNTNTKDNDVAYVQKSESRLARLTISYKFGSNKFSSRKHVSSSETEKSRVN